MLDNCRTFQYFVSKLVEVPSVARGIKNRFKKNLILKKESNIFGLCYLKNVKNIYMREELFYIDVKD